MGFLNIFNKNGKQSQNENHVLIFQQRVTNSILQQIRSIFGLKEQVFLNIWVSGAQQELMLCNQSYRSQLRLTLDNANYTQVQIEEIHSHKPNAKLKPIELDSRHVWITLSATPIGEINKRDYNTTALISAMKGTDLLMAESYLLQSEDQKQWNIGRGETIDRPGVFRENHIVINDIEANRRVSSQQANITWHEGTFYITPCPSGCSATGGTTTRLLRQNEIIELLSPSVATPLQDDDIIELAHHFKLRFKLIEE